MDILYAENDQRVKAYSSIDQYKGFIATYERGGWTPIEFDELKHIDCEKVVSQPVIIEFDDKVGYNFPIGECEYSEDLYPKFDRKEVELRALNECLGGGFYQAAVDEENIVNFDGAGLGVHNNYKLKIGQDYYLSDDFLPAENN